MHAAHQYRYLPSFLFFFPFLFSLFLPPFFLSSFFCLLLFFCLRQNLSGCHVMVVFHKFPQSGRNRPVRQTSVSCGTCREQGITLEMDVGSLLASNSCVGRLYFGTSPTFAREISLNGQTNMTRIVLIVPILARSHH